MRRFVTSGRRRALSLPALLVISAIARPAFAQLAPASSPATAASPSSEPSSLPAEGPSNAALATAKQHFRAGIAAYNDGRFEDAISELKQAYLLSHIPVLLFNIADTYEKMGQPVKALRYYERYLAEAKPDEQQVPAARRRVEALRAIAATQPVTSQPPSVGGTVVGATPRGPREFHHDVVDSAPPNLPLDVHAEVPAEAKTITLFYREPGHDQFTSVPMRPRYREWVGRVPASAMSGTSVQYYVEARDADSSIIGHSGKASSPNIVYIDPSAPPQYYADFGAGPLVSQQPVVPSPQPREASAGSRRDHLYRDVTVGAAVGSALAFSAAIALNRLAAYESSAYEGQAVRSSTPGGSCATPPCQRYAPSLRAYETLGHAEENASYWAAGAGIGLALVTGASYWLWTRAESAESERPVAPAETPESPSPEEPSGPTSPDDLPPPTAERGPSFVAAPMITPSGAGFAAALTF